MLFEKITKENGSKIGMKPVCFDLDLLQISDRYMYMYTALLVADIFQYQQVGDSKFHVAETLPNYHTKRLQIGRGLIISLLKTINLNNLVV